MDPSIQKIEKELNSVKKSFSDFEHTLTILKSSISLMESFANHIQKTIPSIESSLEKLKNNKKKESKPDIEEHKEIAAVDDKSKEPLKRTRTLNNGLEMPLIGLGSSRISNIVEVVYNSIKDGLRLIDTAFKYGN